MQPPPGHELDEHGPSYSTLADQARVLKQLADGVAGRDVLGEICRIAAERFAGVGCAVLALETTAKKVELLASAAVAPPFAAALGSLGAAAARRVFPALVDGTARFCEAMSEDPQFAPLQAAAAASGLEACWSAPIRAPSAGGAPPAVVGLVCLVQPERKRPAPRGAKVLELLAALAGLALERERASRSSLRDRWIDPLTRLPGRQLFERLLGHAIDSASPEKDRFAVLQIDLDRFLEINDTYGFRVGDFLLSSFAQRLQRALRRNDLAARLEGDCFVLLLRMEKDAEEVEQLAARFRTEGRQAFEVETHRIPLTCSLGVAVYPWDGLQAQTLIGNAEVALRAARGSGGDRYQIYSAGLRAGEAAARVAAPGTAGEAPRLEELELVWEPVFETASRKFAGFSARLAWRRPGGSRAGASDFWRAAAQSGLTAAATRWQLRNALLDHQRWSTSPGEAPTLSLPIAPQQLAGEGFVGTALELFAECRVAPSRVAFEVPVVALGRDAETHLPRLAELARAGCALELTGVGGGNLPLDSLAELVFRVWKLDPYLTRTARLRPANGLLVNGLVAFVHALGGLIQAEQVDDPMDLGWLGVHRVDLAQGPALRRPMTGDQVLRFLAEGARATEPR